MKKINIFFVFIICTGCSFNPEKYIEGLEDFVRFETAFDVAGSQEPVNAYIISTSKDYPMCWETYWHLKEMCFAINTKHKDMLLNQIGDSTIDMKDFSNPHPLFYDLKEAHKYMYSKVMYYYNTVPIDFSDFKKIDRNTFSIVENNTFMTYQIRKVSLYTLEKENSYNNEALSFNKFFEISGEENKIKFFFKYYLNYRFKKDITYKRIDGVQELE